MMPRSRHVAPVAFLLTASLFAAASSACSSTDADSDDGEGALQAGAAGTCNEDCVVDLMRQLNKVFRPSGKEDKVRDWVNGLIAGAVSRGVWAPNELTSDVDSAGNLLVRVPATGRFKDKGLRPIAVQSHMDMVLAVDGAPPGAALEPYFANGLDIVEENGIMHTRDYKTTLGADDGVGVAEQARYVLDRSLEHPALELVFTTREEASALGAIGYDVNKLPLHAGAFISLDGMSFDLASGPIVGVGAQGAVNSEMDAVLPSADLSAGTKQIRLTLKGLRGGHSGNAIHEKRLNAMRALGALTVKLAAIEPGAQIVDVTIGEVQARKGLNKIPDAFDAVFAVSGAANVEAIRAALSAEFASVLAPYTAENVASVSFVVQEVPATPATAITSALTGSLARAIVSVPNGVITTDPAFPNSVSASSSIDILGINGGAQQKSLYFGWLPRAFDLQTALSTTQTISQTFAQAIREGHGSEPKLSTVVVQPWLINDRDSKLVALARKSAPILAKSKMSGGYQEVGTFWSKFPNIHKDNTMGIWCAITDPHTPKESLNIQSLHDSATALQKVIEGIGDDGSFLKAARTQ